MSWFAQAPPSSAVRVGMTPSKRTLDAGLKQVVVASRFSLTLEQWPTLDDPFADITPTVEKLKLCGTITVKEFIKKPVT